MSITKIWAREILDSRGNPTVEVDLYTARGTALAWTEPALRPTPTPTPQCWARRPGRGSFRDSQQGWGAGSGSWPGLWGLDAVVQGSQERQASVF